MTLHVVSIKRKKISQVEFEYQVINLILEPNTVPVWN